MWAFLGNGCGEVWTSSTISSSSSLNDVVSQSFLRWGLDKEVRTMQCAEFWQWIKWGSWVQLTSGNLFFRVDIFSMFNILCNIYLSIYLFISLKKKSGKNTKWSKTLRMRTKNSFRLVKRLQLQLYRTEVLLWRNRDHSSFCLALHYIWSVPQSNNYLWDSFNFV